MSQEGSGQGGNTRRHPESSSNFGKGCSSTWQCRGKLWSGRKGVQERGCRSRRAPPTFSLRSLHIFRVLLLRRLGLPLPLTARFCRCGHPLDSCGHHRAACARAGVLGRRGYAVESAAGRICREAGGRVTQNIMVRDLDLEHLQGPGGRRLEVVADGLPLFGGPNWPLTRRW